MIRILVSSRMHGSISIAACCYESLFIFQLSSLHHYFVLCVAQICSSVSGANSKLLSDKRKVNKYSYAIKY